jgi:signal transduction histidine kinase/CheY-like chemotaxis protein
VSSQRQQINNLETALEVVAIVGLGVGLLAGLAGVALFTSGITRRVTAAVDNADRIGRGQPLLPTPASADELGRLADALADAQHLLSARSVELVAARDEAVQATQSKNAFLSRTSHELRTPLNAILGFAQLLEMSDLRVEDRDSAEHILKAGRHLLALINEVLDIARIEAGELSLSLEPVPLAPLTTEVATLMLPLAATRSIAIEHHCGPGALTALADRQRLAQVLLNLVSNAVKYNRDGGVVAVNCRAVDDKSTEITVADTGPGLSDEDARRIFLPFERLGAEQSDVEGTGIGLALARALTEAMNGRLTVTSELGRGSTFSVILPRTSDVIAEVPAVDSSAEMPRPVARASLKAAVLLIEDNEPNIEVITRLLHNRPDTTLQVAMSGQLGIDLARQHRPDIVLLDLHLPDLSGDDVLARLRADPATATIPVVVLSADATEGSVRRLLASGARAYLTKPLDLAQLTSLLDAIPAEPVR